MVAGCTPRTDVARYWTVANTTPQRVIAYLHAHASKDFGPGGIASVRQGKRLLQLSLYSPSTQPNSNSSLSYVVMRLDSQTVGVSAKVDFIAPDATCTRFALLATASTTS
jgi:hypothetical protein